MWARAVSLNFLNSSFAGSAVITNTGGRVLFGDSSNPLFARITTNGAGVTDFSVSSGSDGLGQLTVGSIAGSGTYFLGANKLTIGAGTNLVTTVSGTIGDCGGGACAAGFGSGGSIDYQGAGTLILSGDNTYTGGTTISSGTLQIGNGGTTGSILGDVVDAGTLAFDRSDPVTFTGAISGTGGLTKLGASTLTLSGVNSYSGPTLVTEGTLRPGAGGAFSPSSAFTVSTGAVLDLNGLSQTIGSLAGGGNVTLGFGNLATGFDNSSTTFSGVISGNGGSLTKDGTGIFTLSGANTYNGETFLNQGTLGIGNSQALGTGGLRMLPGTTVQAEGNGFTLANAINLNGNGNFDTNGFTLTLSGAITDFAVPRGVAEGSVEAAPSWRRPAN